MADAVITEYGADSNSVHSADGYTHSTWFSAKSLASLERALEALIAADRKLSPEERKKQDTDFAGTKHSDLLLRSIFYRSRTTRTDGGYTMVSLTVVQPGKGREYRELWDKYNKPVYERLFADGTVTAYGMDAELIHTADSGVRTVWYVVPNVEALDKVQAALDENAQKRSPEEGRAIGRAFADVTVAGSHRDYLSRILHHSAKY